MYKPKSEETIIECLRILLLAETDHNKKSKANKTPAQHTESQLIKNILKNDESVRKFILSDIIPHDKNIYHELMNRQIYPSKKPMNVTKINLEHTKTLFLSDK